MTKNQRFNRLRQLPCCQCGHPPRSQVAHSNFSEHGKGKGIKADDKYTIPLCAKCHRDFDQYADMNRAKSKAWFEQKLKFINEVLDGSGDKAVF